MSSKSRRIKQQPRKLLVEPEPEPVQCPALLELIKAVNWIQSEHRINSSKRKATESGPPLSEMTATINDGENSMQIDASELHNKQTLKMGTSVKVNKERKRKSPKDMKKKNGRFGIRAPRDPNKNKSTSNDPTTKKHVNNLVSKILGRPINHEDPEDDDTPLAPQTSSMSCQYEQNVMMMRNVTDPSHQKDPREVNNMISNILTRNVIQEKPDNVKEVVRTNEPQLTSQISIEVKAQYREPTLGEFVSSMFKEKKKTLRLKRVQERSPISSEVELKLTRLVRETCPTNLRDIPNDLRSIADQHSMSFSQVAEGMLKLCRDAIIENRQQENGERIVQQLMRVAKNIHEELRKSTLN